MMRHMAGETAKAAREGMAGAAPAAAAKARPVPPRAAPSVAGDGSTHRAPMPPPPSFTLARLRPPDAHTWSARGRFRERSIVTRSATAAAWMAGLDPASAETESSRTGGPLAPVA